MDLSAKAVKMIGWGSDDDLLWQWWRLTVAVMMMTTFGTGRSDESYFCHMNPHCT